METAPNERLETPDCPVCEKTQARSFISAQDDLTGKPGTFHFAECRACGHHFQSPRLKIDFIGDYYDDGYISHKKGHSWGPLGKLAAWGFGKHDRDKYKLVSRFVKLARGSRVLDVGCARGTFLQEVSKRTGASIAGVDFKDLPESDLKSRMTFHHGLLKQAPLAANSFDLITMWHYLEHCYEPIESLRICRYLLKDEGRMVIEVPCLSSVTYRLYGSRWPGLQAPQHTSLFTRKSLERLMAKAGFEVVEYLPYGAFPRFFYYYAGFVFLFTKGKGIKLSSHVVPYILLSAIFYPFIKVTEKWFSHSMQTVVCRKRGH